MGYGYSAAVEYLRSCGLTRADARETLKMAREGAVSSVGYLDGVYTFKGREEPVTDVLEAFGGKAAVSDGEEYEVNSEGYIFKHNGHLVTISRDRLRTFIQSYVKDGLNVDFIAACRRAGIPETKARIAKNVIGITKSYPPFLPDEYHDMSDKAVVRELEGNRYSRLKTLEERSNNRKLAREVQQFRDKDAWLQARLAAVENIDLQGLNRKQTIVTNYGPTAFVGTHDLHFGKRQWDDVPVWDNKPLMNAIDNIASNIQQRQCTEVVTFFGSDMFNVDNVNMTTTRGTNQRNLATMGEMADDAMEYFCYAVNKLSEVAPVTVYVIAGNHDRSLVNFAGALLARVFMHNPNVTIFYSDTVRQYHACGDTVVCIHHGDIRTKELDQVARVEAHDLLGMHSKRLIIMQGHYHKFNLEQKGNTTYTTATSGGPQDSWERENFGKALDRQITTYYVKDSGPIVGIDFTGVI